MAKPDAPKGNSNSVRTLLNRYRPTIWIVLAVLWMVLIYLKSAEPYQAQDIRPQLASWIQEERLMQTLPHVEFTYDGDFITYKKPYDMLEFFLRKLGHMAEFGLLAVLWLNVFRSQMKSRSISMLSALVISALYAATDEWHQSFVPNRTGHAIDVVVDAVGIILALGAYAVIVLLRRSRRNP